jgi:hypothetical protein
MASPSDDIWMAIKRLEEVVLRVETEVKRLKTIRAAKPKTIIRYKDNTVLARSVGIYKSRLTEQRRESRAEIKRLQKENKELHKFMAADL